MAKSGSPRLPWTAYHIRSTGALGTDTHCVWNVAPWSVLTLLDRLVRFCRSEKKMSPFLSSANSVSPPPWKQVRGFPSPTWPGIIWKLLPWSSDCQMKLCAVDEPLGTLEYQRSLPSIAMSGSKPDRCWSTTTSWEKRSAGSRGADALAPATRAPMDTDRVPAAASSRTGRRGMVNSGAGRRKVDLRDTTTELPEGNEKSCSAPGDDVVTDPEGAGQTRPPVGEVRVPGGSREHLPRPPADGHELVGEAGVQRSQCRRGAGRERLVDRLVELGRPRVDVTRGLHVVTGGAVAHDEQGHPVRGVGQVGTDLRAVGWVERRVHHDERPLPAAREVRADQDRQR